MDREHYVGLSPWPQSTHPLEEVFIYDDSLSNNLTTEDNQSTNQDNNLLDHEKASRESININSLNEEIVSNVPLFANEAIIDVVKFVDDSSVDQVIVNLSPDNLASHAFDSRTGT